VSAGLVEALAKRASTRNLDDLTLGPVLTASTEEMMGHKDRLLAIPGVWAGGYEGGG